MLISLLRGNLDFASAIAGIFAVLLIVFIVLPFHELAHAYTAMKLGDTSVKYSGRLTLNPLAHIDPFGALALLLFGIGWAKPVMIDTRNFKRPKLYMAITAIMGPVANILAATVGALILNALCKFVPDLLTQYAVGFFGGTKAFGYYLLYFLIYYIQINCFIAVFNLLPIPPLDGSKVLFMFLPDRWLNKIYRYQQIISIVFIALLFSRVLDTPLNFLGGGLMDGVIRLTGYIFGSPLG